MQRDQVTGTRQLPVFSGMHVNSVSGALVAAAFKVHSALGPGLLESVYRACLACQLRKDGPGVETERILPVVYDGVRLDVGHRIDMLVEDVVVVEVKAVSRVVPLHEAQLLSCLKLSGRHVGLILNFHVPLLRDGIRRMVN